MRNKEEKLAIVKRNLSGEPARVLAKEIGTSDKSVRDWERVYLTEGESGLEPKKKPGNPLSRYERRKELTYEEQFQYQIELLKRELVKKGAEVLRLKNGTKRGRCPKKMIQEMYANIQKQTSKHSVSDLCSIYEVSRSGYYKWLKRADHLTDTKKQMKYWITMFETFILVTR